jgi:hypothetical protein
MQKIDESLVQAVNSRTDAVLGQVRVSTEAFRLKGRNPGGPNEIRRSSMAKLSLYLVSSFHPMRSQLS